MASGSDSESLHLVERMGRLMLLFRLHVIQDCEENPMDLALIRVMDKANRTGAHAIPCIPAEKRVTRQGMDAPNASSKLGELCYHPVVYVGQSRHTASIHRHPDRMHTRNGAVHAKVARDRWQGHGLVGQHRGVAQQLHNGP